MSRAADLVREVRAVGRDAAMVDLRDDAAAHVPAALAQALSGARDAGRLNPRSEVVPGARTVLVQGVDVSGVQEILAGLDVTQMERGAVSTVEVPAIFDGADLDEVSRQWDMPVAAVAETLVGTEFTVAFCGFAPGFAYMSGLGRERSVARRESPRTRVPAGSIALAGEYLGIYPRTSPGGWQLVGTAVGVTLWDVEATPPALLAPGTKVRLVPAKVLHNDVTEVTDVTGIPGK